MKIKKKSYLIGLLLLIVIISVACSQVSENSQKFTSAESEPFTEFTLADTTTIEKIESTTETTRITRKEIATTTKTTMMSTVTTKVEKSNDSLSTNTTEKPIAGNPTSNSTADRILSQDGNTDLFILNGIVCVNATNSDWVQKLELKIDGEAIGEIKHTAVKENWQNGDATHLSVGTKIYSYPDRVDIVIAKQNDVLIPYLKWIEG